MRHRDTEKLWDLSVTSLKSYGASCYLTEKLCGLAVTSLTLRKPKNIKLTIARRKNNSVGRTFRQRNGCNDEGQIT